MKKIINLLNMHNAGDLNIVYFHGQIFLFSDKLWYLPASTEQDTINSIKKHLAA